MTSRDTSVHANTPEQARANARMAKLRREGAVADRTPAELRRALQRRFYNARRRERARNDQVALDFIAEMLEELKGIDANSEGAETALQLVEASYEAWMARGSMPPEMLARVPLLLEPQPEGGYVVTSPLLPELVTEGDTISECLVHAEDAFAAVTEIYEDYGRPLPSSVHLDNGGPLLVEALLPIPESDEAEDA